MASRKNKPQATAQVDDNSDDSEPEDDVLILNNNDPFDMGGAATTGQ